MVSEVVEAPSEQTDQVLEPEVTEDAPAPDEQAVAAPEVQEAAVEEPAQIEPEERRYTQAELDAQARNAAQQAIEYDRRMRQSENARKAADAQREQREAVELRDTTEVILSKAERDGWTEEQRATALIERISSKRAGFDVERAQGEMQQALAWVTAPLRGDPRSYEEFGLSPTADAFARAIQPHLQQIMSAGQSAALEGYIPQSELPKLVDAEIARRNAKAREGKTELKRVDGTPSAPNTLGTWETRVAHQGEEGHPMMTDADWREYRQIRKEHGL